MIQVPDPQQRGSVVISGTKQLQQAYKNVDEVHVQA
jgi:hypothetical protein